MTQSFRLARRALTALTLFPLLSVISPVAMGDAKANAFDATEDQRTGGLEEIIVTARRRQENAQQVPISITAISPEAIRDNNITTIQDLQFLSPSLTVTTANVGQRDTANVTIRGQGWGSFGQPAVAVYLNEVPIPADFNNVLAGGPGLYFDLENIQVLKGPQGTLFGRNTMGGAVLVQSARPTNDFGGRLQVGYGNYNDREIDGEINLPIIDEKLLARIAINGQIRDGFTHVQSMPGYPSGIDLDNRDTRSIRATLSYRPTAAVQNDAILTYQTYTSHGSSDFLSRVDPNGPAVATYGATALALLAQQQALGARNHLPIDINLNGTGGNLFALENITKIDPNDQFTFRNIFGFHRAVFNEKADLFGTILPIFEDVSDRDPAQQITDEIQVLGNAFGKRLDWVAGAFYSDQGPFPDRNHFSALDLRVLLPVGSAPDVVNVPLLRRVIIKSHAIFAQGTYDLSDVISGLKLTGGVRDTWDENISSSGVINSVDSKSSAPTWTAALDYQVVPNTSVYFTSRKGYRAGGSDQASNGVLFPFNPEYVTDFEVGVKSDWKVADVPVRTNAAVYYQSYSSIQVNQIIPYPGQIGGLNITSNAGDARLWGGEFEAQAILTKSFQIGANFSYLSFKYTKFGQGVDGASLVAGETANRIPREYGFNARYYLPVPDAVGEVSARANYHWQAQYGDFLGTQVIPAFGLLNLSLSWDNIAGAPFDAQIFVSNALNKTYVSGGIAFLGVGEYTYGDPRLYGVHIAYRFGAQRK